MGRAVFLGDVHGCLEELDELVGRLELRAGDRLFFVGDLVDRGPDSAGAVRRIRELLERWPGSGVVCGNHEELALRYREKQRPLPDWAPAMRDEDWAFLDGLPLVIFLHELDVSVVHGGFFPAFFEKHMRVGSVGPGWRQEKSKRADRQRRFLRVRHVNPETGQMLALGTEGPDDPHWSRRYDGQEGHVFFGHDPQLAPPEPLRAKLATGLDTGCCFGGRLTAAVLEPGVAPVDARIVSVAARARYAEPRYARTVD